MKEKLINISSFIGLALTQLFIIFCINGCFNSNETYAQKGNDMNFETVESEEELEYNIEKSEEEWKSELSEEEYQILRKKGTERAFTGKYDHHFEDGVYKCAGCGEALFDSDTKYDSGCGWPAFYYADSTKINYIEDNSYGMQRIEVVCANCGGHLGHVFPDGPRDKTGIRYCINSVSLNFEKDTTKTD
jgi:peptide-methionine (R)-S-oxide reductase